MLVATALKIGLSLSDLDKITIGFLADIMQSVSGEDNGDINEKYRQLKSIEKIVETDYRNGKISKEKYDSYHKALSEYEEVN